MSGDDDGTGGFGKIARGLAELIKVLTEADKTGTLPRHGRREKDGFVVEYSLGKRVLDESAAERPEPEAQRRSRSTQRPAKPTQLEMREPVIDFFDEPDEVVVLYELPGVERKNIHYRLAGDILLLEARTDDRLYRKETLIEAKLAQGAPRARLRNGVLELRLAKQE